MEWNSNGTRAQRPHKGWQVDLGRLSISSVLAFLVFEYGLSSDTLVKIQVWLVAPYKKPEADGPENTRFNNHVSMVHIQSEHAIGFLKGQFASLKHLRISIVDEAAHIFVTYWIAVCIGLHSFAMMCEDNENPDHDLDNVESGWQDPFIDKGLSSGPSFVENEHFRPNTQYSQATQRLCKAKANCEKIKQLLFRALDDLDD